MIVALRIAKAGFYQGDPEKVLNGRVDYVLATLEYNKFLSDYEDVFIELNKKEK